MRDSEMKELEAFLKEGTTTVYEKYDALTDMYIEYTKLQEDMERMELRKLRYEDMLYNYTDLPDDRITNGLAEDNLDYSNVCRLSKIQIEAQKRTGKLDIKREEE